MYVNVVFVFEFIDIYTSCATLMCHMLWNKIDPPTPEQVFMAIHAYVRVCSDLGKETQMTYIIYTITQNN